MTTKAKAVKTTEKEREAIENMKAESTVKVADTKKDIPKTDFDPSKINITKNHSIPNLNMKLGKIYYLKFVSEIKMTKEYKKGDEVIKPFPTCEVIDMETGELNSVALGAVVEGTFKDEYENNAFVGKCFALTKLAKAAGGRYNNYTMQEFEV